MAASKEAQAWVSALGWADMRKWSEFVQELAPPKTWAEIEERSLTNLVYYRTNYFAIALVVFVWSLLSNFALLAAFIVILSSWMYIFGVRKTPIVVGTTVLSQLHKAIVLSVGSYIVLVLFGCFWTFLQLVLIAVTLAVAHALLRKRSKASRMVRSFLGVKVFFKKALTASDSDEDDDDAGDAAPAEEAVEEGYTPRKRGGDDAHNRSAYAARRAAVSKRTGGL